MSVPEDTDPSLFRAGAVHVSGILSAQRSVGAGSGRLVILGASYPPVITFASGGLSLARLEFHSTVLCGSSVSNPDVSSPLGQVSCFGSSIEVFRHQDT